MISTAKAVPASPPQRFMRQTALATRINPGPSSVFRNALCTLQKMPITTAEGAEEYTDQNFACVERSEPLSSVSAATSLCVFVFLCSLFRYEGAASLSIKFATGNP